MIINKVMMKSPKVIGMGIKVHGENYPPDYQSMRDPNDGSSSSNWPLIYGDKGLRNGQFRNDSLANSYLGVDNDVIRKKIIEHDSIFKQQNFELHRLHKIQSDMMGEIKRQELHKQCILLEAPSSSSIPLGSQMHPEDAWKLKKSKSPYLRSNTVEVRSSPLTSARGGSQMHPEDAWKLKKSKSPYLRSNTVEVSSSLLTSARGNITQTDRLLSQNECSSNDCEILEVRPLKVRKKLFDLERPGDEYIDLEEDEQPQNKVPDMSSRNHRLSSLDMKTESKLKLEYSGDAYISSSSLRNHIGLADLNAPVEAEEPTHPSTVDLSNLSHSDLGVHAQMNHQYRSGNGILNSLHVENNGYGRERIPSMYSGQYASNLKFVPHGAQGDYSLMSHKTKYSTFEKGHNAPSIIQSNRIREGSKNYASQHPGTSRDLSSLYHLEPVSTLTHKSFSIQTNPPPNSIGTLNMSSQLPSQQLQDICNRLNTGSVPTWITNPPARVPLIDEGSKFNKYGKVASERSINYSPLKMAEEVNLNTLPSKSSCIEIVDLEKDCGDPLKVFPWMKSRTLEASNQFSTQKISEGKIFGVPNFDKSCCIPKESSSLISTSASLKDKPKSVTIDINLACDMEGNTEIAEGKPNACEKESDFRALFDLNSYASEDETTLIPSMTSTNANIVRNMIDLEMPPVPESDEEILPLPQPRDEADLVAAQALLTISSCTISLAFEVPSQDPLLWFVETVSSYIDGFENLGTTSKTSPKEMDEYEALTLNLKEMTEEEYMPKYLVPEIPEPDDNENVSAPTRRGPGRRRTRRRDFQRDILPGIATLSRQEVSEDIQILEGCMRTTGHVWSSRLTRKNGRRRVTVDPPVNDVVEPVAICPSLVQAVNKWGETPRRPRRQRGAQR